jgi:hypothetical protein
MPPCVVGVVQQFVVVDRQKRSILAGFSRRE